MSVPIADFVASIGAVGLEGFSKVVDVAGAAITKLGSVSDKSLKGIIAAAGAAQASLARLATGASAAATQVSGSFSAVFSIMGKRDVALAIDDVDKKSKAAVSSTGKLNSVFTSMTGVVTGLKTQLIGATAGIFAFVSAGIVGTVEGEILSQEFSRMARAVAGLFIPVMQSAVRIMTEVRNWIHSLSESQRDSLLKWSGLVGGIVLFSTSLGRIPGAILLVTQGFRLLNEQSTGLKVLGVVMGLALAWFMPLPGILLAATSGMALFSQTGVSGLDSMTSSVESLIESAGQLIKVFSRVAQIVGIVATAAGVLASVLSGQWWATTIIAGGALTAGGVAAGMVGDKVEGMKKRPGGAGGAGGPDTTPKAPGFEDVGSTYKRIAEGVINQTFNAKEAADKQAALTEETNRKLQTINDSIAAQPAMPTAWDWAFRNGALAGP
jgi:hypothetical protein